MSQRRVFWRLVRFRSWIQMERSPFLVRLDELLAVVGFLGVHHLAFDESAQKALIKFKNAIVIGDGPAGALVGHDDGVVAEPFVDLFAGADGEQLESKVGGRERGGLRRWGLCGR